MKYFSFGGDSLTGEHPKKIFEGSTLRTGARLKKRGINEKEQLSSCSFLIINLAVCGGYFLHELCLNEISLVAILAVAGGQRKYLILFKIGLSAVNEVC